MKILKRFMFNLNYKTVNNVNMYYGTNSEGQRARARDSVVIWLTTEIHTVITDRMKLPVDAKLASVH